MTRIIIIIIAAMLAFKGFKGLISSKQLVKYTMEEVESNGVGNDKYVEISGGNSVGHFVYEPKTGDHTKASKVIFPLISASKYNSYMESDDTVRDVKVIVLRSLFKYKSNCIEDGSCLDDILSIQESGNFVIRGTVNSGVNGVDDETKELFENSIYKLNPNVLYLQEDKKPLNNIASIILLLVGLSGILLVGGSYYLKRKQKLRPY